MKRFTAFVLCLVFALAACAYADEYHYYDDFFYIGKGYHQAVCRHDGCGHKKFRECAVLSCTYEGAEFSVCPVCGHSEEAESKRQYFPVILFNYDHAPKGETLAFVYESPFGVESDVAYAISAIFEYAGRIDDYEGMMQVSIKLACPEEFTLLKAKGDELSETEYTYDAESETLTFISDDFNVLYLIKRV
ncbi:MAG: hypothetical protein IKR85_00910 [Clostridia bacterium]|nr:hypothetical protein [Clostridia bacterium]